MKARIKITLWTASFTLTVAICFSGFVFYELLEQPFRLIDAELKDIAEVVGQTVSNSNTTHLEQTNSLARHPYEKYWIKVGIERGNNLFTSQMARNVEIPARSDKKFYFVKKAIPIEKIWIAQEDRDEIKDLATDLITFQVMVDKKIIKGKVIELQVAKPIPILVQELIELIGDILLGIMLFTIIAIAASYYLAGKILQPLASINSLIKNISDNSLDTRIPLGKNFDELYILARSLNGMFDRLQYSFNRQKEFIGNASHELKSPLTILMLGHEEMLQMVINLVDNAIKYNAPENGRIWVATQRTKEYIHLTLANTGSVIPEADLPRVFDQFFRVEKSRSATYGGSGLGLTIVKQIVELHHGTISVTSSTEGITRFAIDFPLPPTQS